MTGGDDFLGFGVGGAAVEECEHVGFADPDVFELGQSGAGKDRQGGSAAASDGHDDVFGQAGQADGLGFADPESELVETGELEDAGLADVDAEERGGGFAGVERTLAGAGDAHQVKTAGVGHAGAADEDELGDFGVGGVELAEVFDGLVPHAGLVERAEVDGLDAVAAGQDENGQKRRKDEALRKAKHQFHSTGARDGAVWGVTGRLTGEATPTESGQAPAQRDRGKKIEGRKEESVLKIRRAVAKRVGDTE